jgi:plasmid stabilization system protein ParE
VGRKVIISPSAQSDLSDIVAYIARHNREAAVRLGYALIARGEFLGQFPERGRVVPELGRADLRETIYRSYRIIYRIRSEPQVVEIVRFWHAARGFPQVPAL